MDLITKDIPNCFPPLGENVMYIPLTQLPCSLSVIVTHIFSTPHVEKSSSVFVL